MKPLDPEVKTARKLERLAVENSALRAANRKLARNGAGYEDIVDELRALIGAAPAAPFVLSPSLLKPHVAYKASPAKKGHAEIAALCLSDWHVSETVRPHDVNGLNDYNSMIAANRVYEIVQSAKGIIALHQAMYKIERIWLPTLGDMTSGSIHQELAMSNDLSDAAATVLVAHLLYMLVMELCTLGIPIEMDCQVGNHPRLTENMPTKRQTDTNLDWVAYEMLSAMLAKNKQVQVNIHTGQITTVKRYGWSYVIEHGYGIKHGKEEDAENRLRALFDDPIYRDANGHTGTAFDQLLIGDQHNPKLLARTIVNGSLVGCSSLTTAWRLRPIRAVQQMFGISKGHARTWSYPLDVTDIRTPEPYNDFSRYTQQFLATHKR